MNKSKKIISIIAAAALSFSALALTGCGTEKYKGDQLTAGYDKTAAVSSNGGFAVEKGDYVYFINGSAANTADNTYGDVVKGSLMRISKAKLAEEQYAEAQVVIPSLFVAGDMTAGIFIYGEYVYYATPTTDKDTKTGEVQNTYLDFKRSKLDGSEAPMGGKNDYFFRLSSNTAKYRFVEEGEKVYCLFEEDSKLKSYNVETGETTVLVSGASSFYYDLKNPTNANVYYTMGVTYDLDKATSTKAQYTQVYSVNAANTAVTDKATASYKVLGKDGKEIKTYDFDEKFMEEKAEEKGYDLGDYTTYPYVNLGTLVLDGVGTAPSPSADGRFNWNDKEDSREPLGYTYTLQSYQNGGLYFTRTSLTKTQSDSDDTKLYYLTDAREASWNTVTGNAKVQTVALNTDKASSTALFEIENGAHVYYYLDGTILKKATANANGVATTVNLAYEVSAATLWKKEGNYLYYYAAASNGNNVTRINVSGDAAAYNPHLVTDEYKPQTLPLVDWNSAWYKPEFVTLSGGKQVLLYANAQTYGAGSTSYNYVYAAKVGTTDDIIAAQDEIDKVNEEINSYTDNAALQNVMRYFFKTGKTNAFDAVKDVEGLYTTYQKDTFAEFLNMFKKDGEFEGRTYDKYINLVGRLTEEDKEAIEESWANYLLSKEEVVEDDSLPTWALVLIIVGGALIVAAGVTIPLVITAKKKAAKKRAEEAIVSAYKRKKIDTTDDKTIDVYADETTEESTETEPETVEETVEEEAEEVVEETVEESTEEVAEEPSQE